MFCPNCGCEIKEGSVFCDNCGAKIVEPQTASEPPKAEPEPQPVPPVQNPQPVIIQQAPITKDTLPAKFRPLSAWAYFGYSILFSIPIVGFIFLIIFSFNGRNINRRSFARSYWCGFLLIAIICGIVLLISALTGGIASLVEWIKSLF